MILRLLNILIIKFNYKYIEGDPLVEEQKQVRKIKLVAKCWNTF